MSHKHRRFAIKNKLLQNTDAEWSHSKQHVYWTVCVRQRYTNDCYVESSWNVMAHGDTREGKWRGNWWMEWVASTLHTTSEHGVSSITTADAHTSAAGSRLNWRPRRFKWTRPFRRKTKCGFCACAITFQTQSKAGRLLMMSVLMPERVVILQYGTAVFDGNMRQYGIKKSYKICSRLK